VLRIDLIPAQRHCLDSIEREHLVRALSHVFIFRSCAREYAEGEAP
jgi:hypothetical protein